MRDREIFERAPGLAKRVRPLDIAAVPTAISEEPALALAWGLASLHVKRDDATSPLYGGSKVRALEYLLGRARSRGTSIVTTWGPWGSHHVLAAAVFARQAGLRLTAITFPQPPGREVELNDRLLPDLVTKISRCGTFAHLAARLSCARLWALLDPRRGWVPAGGTSTLGILRMVEAALEVAAQIRQGVLEQPDDVLLAAGSCGTASGLLLGFALAELPVRVVAVRVVPRIAASSRKIETLARRTRGLLRRAGCSSKMAFGPLLFLEAFAGEGYGRASGESLAVVELVHRTGSFRCENTYTGKSLSALQAGVLRNRRVLFWNTYSAVDPRPAPSSNGNDS